MALNDPEVAAYRTRSPDLRAIQRRTVRVLVVAQAVGAVGIIVGVATASLLAEELSGSATLAGLVQSAQTLGAALFALLLARVMAVRGRRPGQVGGLVVGATGALLAVVAGAVGSMALLLVGAVLLGATTASNSAARYAATDLAVPEHRARDLSTVVWATTIGAVLGPNLTGPAGALADGLGLPVLTGPFLLGGVLMVVAACFVLVAMRPDPLLVAREHHRATSDGAPPRPATSALRVITGDRDLAMAVLAQASAHAAMVAVMIMTPLHMSHGGADLEVIGLVISLHVLGMFAFAPLVGRACDRWGRGAVMTVGGLVLVLALLLAGASPVGFSPHVGSGLFLLGVGWSLSTVAAAATIADRAPLEQRPQVQGAADTVMLLAAAGAGAFSGPVVGWWGYGALAVGACGLAAGVLVAGSVVQRHAVGR